MSFIKFDQPGDSIMNFLKFQKTRCTLQVRGTRSKVINSVWVFPGRPEPTAYIILSVTPNCTRTRHASVYFRMLVYNGSQGVAGFLAPVFILPAYEMFLKYLKTLRCDGQWCEGF